MLVSQLGDLTSSAEHRIKKTIAGGSATNTAPAVVHMPQAALNLEKAGASLALRSKLLTGLKPLPKSPLAPSSLVANALRDVKMNLTPATSAPATTAAAAAAAIPPPVTPTPALATTTSALTATPSGGGGGGGGDDLTPADDTSAVPAPTGWAALSTSTKVLIVAGVAGVAFIGYKALRRR